MSKIMILLPSQSFGLVSNDKECIKACSGSWPMFLILPRGTALLPGNA